MRSETRKNMSYLFLPIMALYALAPNCFALTANYQQPTINYPGNHGFSLAENPFRYSGYYCDFESNLYYLKARYYSPKLARFISRDTYDLSNRYAYCDENPINKTDPEGHFSNWVSALIPQAAAMLAGGLGYATGNPLIGAGMSVLGMYLASYGLGNDCHSLDILAQAAIAATGCGFAGAVDRYVNLSKTARDAMGSLVDAGINVAGNIAVQRVENERTDLNQILGAAGLAVGQVMLMHGALLLGNKITYAASTSDIIVHDGVNCGTCAVHNFMKHKYPKGVIYVKPLRRNSGFMGFSNMHRELEEVTGAHYEAPTMENNNIFSPVATVPEGAVGFLSTPGVVGHVEFAVREGHMLKITSSNGTQYYRLISELEGNSQFFALRSALEQARN